MIPAGLSGKTGQPPYRTCWPLIKTMEGRVNKLQYLYEGEFRDAGIDGRYAYFPVTALNFISMGKGRDTLLHGSMCLRMQCSVGDLHMPESTAVFTLFIH